ncbi:Hypothetical protein PBC10988_21310 [Planctomycetales bacterium 10988]|nr:Hypothetical protein PBC10988_21310 [Planctomycetales bacterium 10988]
MNYPLRFPWRRWTCLAALVGITISGSVFSQATQTPRLVDSDQEPAAQAPLESEDMSRTDTQAEPVEPPAILSRKSLPGDITLAKLTNGLTILVQENHVAPVATVRCYVNNTGSSFEGRWLGAGLSHLVEHLVSGGTTKNRSEKEIEEIIDTFGGATNAYTSVDITAYYIDCPSNKTSTAIELIADSMQHVTFEKNEFDREMEVVTRELEKGEVERNRVRWKMLNETAYIENPAKVPTIGYRDVLHDITIDDVKAFYRERYLPNNQLFVVVGDIDTEKVLEEVAQNYAGTPRGRETEIIMPEEPEQISPRLSVREMDGDSIDLTLGWPTIELSNPDLYALDVAAYILTEGKSSRLVRDLVYDQALATSVNSASYTPHYVRGVFVVQASFPPDSEKAVRETILSEVYRLKTELVGEEELSKAKKQKASEVIFGRQTVQDAAESLARSYLSTGDPLFDEYYATAIQRVTPEDIQAVAKKYFLEDRLIETKIVPLNSQLAEEEDKESVGEESIKKYELENGLKVLIKRHPHLPLVNMQAYSLGSSLVETPEQAGLSNLTAMMLDKGTKQFSAEEIATYFDSIGGRMSISAGRSTLYGSATVLKEDFAEAFERFSDCIVQPTFPEDQFAKMQQLALLAIARRATNPQSEIFELFYDALPESTPYHLIQGGKEATVSKLTVSDCQAYHQKYFVPQNMIVTVFGDIEPEAALEAVKRRFGQMPKAENFEPIEYQRDNSIPETTQLHEQTGKPTGMVMMGYPMCSIFEEKEFAAMTVLDAISSGYNYPGGWLHSELRGAGLVYMVHAFNITGPSPGYFAIFAQTEPDTVGEVVSRSLRNMERAKSGDISEEEFIKAQQMIIALHAQSNTTISSQAQTAAVNELYGLGYDYEESFDERIQAVTIEEVIAVAKKYLNDYILVTASSNPTAGLPPQSAALSQ